MEVGDAPSDLNASNLEHSRSSPPESESYAARLNRLVIRKLQRALKADPEVNLQDLLPSEYSSRLKNGKKANDDPPPPESKCEHVEDETSDQSFALRRYRLEHEPATIVFPLSREVRTLLEDTEEWELELGSSKELSRALSSVIEAGERLWPPLDAQRLNQQVIKCGHELVVKISRNDDMHVEHYTLEYLANTKPDFPAPRSHGLVVVGRWRFFFMTFIPGSTLRSVWPTLAGHEKLAISRQLDELFVEIRALPFPAGSTLGSVAEQVCMDARREVRMTKEPIETIQEFDNFRFSNPVFGGSVYIEVLRRMSKDCQPSNVCFTHGDVRTENIIVRRREDGEWLVNGVIDWEMAGFYPEDFECTKVTTTMSTIENDDWFLFLPKCISPTQYPTRWALDRIWGRHLE